MQRHPSGELATCGTWPKLMQSPTAASRSESPLGLGSSSPEQGRRHPSGARTRPRPTDRVRPPSRMAVSTTSCGFTAHTILQEQSAAAVYDEIGQRSFERLFPGLTEDSMTQATLSASPIRIGFKRARDIAATAHLGAHRSQTAHPVHYQ